MSMKEHANNILEAIENDLLAARRRREKIGKAMELLTYAGISEDLLNTLQVELEDAKEELAELMVHRMLVRVGMRENHWLDQND